MIKYSLGLVAGLFLALLITSPVLSHGDAQWIQDGLFLQRNGITICCNIHDCEVMPEEIRKNHIVDTGRVIEVWNKGKIIDTFEKGLGKGVHKSKDEQWWWCRNQHLPKDMQVTNIYCIFYPVGVTFWKPNANSSNS